MKLIMPFILTVIVCCTSCSSTRIFKNLSGKYINKGKDYKITLNLRKDSVFIYRAEHMDVTSEIKGKWKYNLTDTIFLIRDSVVLSEMLSGGYSKEIPNKAFIKNRNTIRMANNLLKRKE